VDRVCEVGGLGVACRSKVVLLLMLKERHGSEESVHRVSNGQVRSGEVFPSLWEILTQFLT
jgi:hypothetical protein